MKLQHGLVNVLINGNFEEDAGTCSVVNDAFQENVSWALLRTFWDMENQRSDTGRRISRMVIHVFDLTFSHPLQP